jgi:hypothetical protein
VADDKNNRRNKGGSSTVADDLINYHTYSEQKRSKFRNLQAGMSFDQA